MRQVPQPPARVHRPPQRLVLGGGHADVAFDLMIEYLRTLPAYADAPYHALALAFGDLREDLHDLLDDTDLSW